MNWIDQIMNLNETFVDRVDKVVLPVQRQTSQKAIITCMDPRINLEALGESTFTKTGESLSNTRIIRTFGARTDDRSLLASIYLAGTKELAIVMHTDCGCCLAWSKINTIIENLESSLADDKLEALDQEIGALEKNHLRKWLKAFEDPHYAVREEVNAIKAKPYISNEITIHGLVYNLKTASIEVVVNGYK